MRVKLTISLPEETHAYLMKECSNGTTVSEYIRALLRGEQQRRKDYAARPHFIPKANDCMVFGEALNQVEKLQAILERKDR